MEFTKLTLDDMDRLAPYFGYATSRACDTTVGGIFIWRDYFKTSYRIENDTLMFRVGEGEDTVYSYPIGKDVDNAFSIIEEDARENAISLNFYLSSEIDMRDLQKRYPSAEINEARDSFDYLYDYDSLATFKGKKYSGQRNHVNKFKRLYENHSFEPLTCENIPAVREFFAEFLSSREKTPATDAEAEKINELFDHLAEYESHGFFGGVLRVDGRVVGFSVAEHVGDTMYVHIEKADIRYDGVYQMLVSSFAAHFSHGDVIYINREDDAGNEGLRKSKLSYQPIALLPKYFASVK